MNYGQYTDSLPIDFHRHNYHHCMFFYFQMKITYMCFNYMKNYISLYLDVNTFRNTNIVVLSRKMGRGTPSRKTWIEFNVGKGSLLYVKFTIHWEKWVLSKKRWAHHEFIYFHFFGFCSSILWKVKEIG